MQGEAIVFRAALARVILGLFSLAVLPLLYPRIAGQRWVFAAYMVEVLVMQLLIRKNLGGNTRSFVGGLIDIAMLTFIVHRVGSHGTVLVAIYLFAGMINALVTPPRIAIVLAVCGSISYVALLAVESIGLLPYGPDKPWWSPGTAPGGWEVASMGGLVGCMVIFATTVVAQLMRAVRSHSDHLVSANQRLEEISQRDPLTQLYNRRFVFSRIESELARVALGGTLSVVMIDLDGFKRVNDEHGHLRGDSLLKEIAGALARSCRGNDVAARYGGDEFIVVLPDTTADQAQPVAERIAAAIRETGLRFDARRPVTGSVGIAQATRGESVAGLLRRADENAYRAKQSGGNRVAA